MKSEMSDTEASAAFDKARSGLWASLQAHLTTLYLAEKTYLDAVAATDSFFVAAGPVASYLLDEYWKQRKVLRDLYTDETNQLAVLVKTIRTKAYAADEKRQLYLLILGYISVLASVAKLLDTHASTILPQDAELAETAAQFSHLQKLVHLYIKGVNGLVTTLD